MSLIMPSILIGLMVYVLRIMNNCILLRLNNSLVIFIRYIFRFVNRKKSSYFSKKWQ